MKSVWKDNQRVNGWIWHGRKRWGGGCADRKGNGRKGEKKRKERWGGWERWNVEVGEGTAERGGESDDDEEGEVHAPYGEVHTHTPCGGLTEAMWDCSWNNKQRDVSGGLEDRELLTCGPALCSRLDSATERTRNDLSCCSLSTMISIFFFFDQNFGSQSVNSVLKCFETTSVHLIIPTFFFFLCVSVDGETFETQAGVGVSSKWLKPGWCENAPSVQPGAQQSTSLPSLCLHSSMTVSHAVFIIWIGGCWHQSVGCEAKLTINSRQSLKCTIKSKCACGGKHIWTYVS